ncbi:unnamed protein product [Periconia digitata]|uniref:Uncharacterized protein n=1 Tax=Periconia digitata TaxID=1303443 RepID=A0A9W4UKJ6_9PLEO|nr:unnamed protein product [Periconia digitata]
MEIGLEKVVNEVDIHYYLLDHSPPEQRKKDRNTITETLPPSPIAVLCWASDSYFFLRKHHRIYSPDPADTPIVPALYHKNMYTVNEL